MFAKIDETFGQIDFVANIAGEAVRKKPEVIELIKSSDLNEISSMAVFVFGRKLVDAC